MAERKTAIEPLSEREKELARLRNARTLDCNV